MIPADSLVEAVTQKLFTLRNLVLEYEVAIPQFACRHFLSSLKLILDAIEASCSEAIPHYKNVYSDISLREQNISEYCLAILQLCASLESKYLEKLHLATAESDYTILPSLQRLMQLFEPNVELTLVPTFDYTFGCGGLKDFVKQHIDELFFVSPTTRTRLEQQAASLTLPEWIAFVSFPLVERDNALLLSAISHELAHLIERSQKPKPLSTQLLPGELDKVSFEGYVQELWRNRLPGGALKSSKQAKLPVEDLYPITDVREECYELCTRTVDTWLQETICDSLAIHALGPAYLFAFLEFIGRGGYENKPDEEHPAPAERALLMLGELEFLRYFKVRTGVYEDLIKVRAAVQDAASKTDYRNEELVADATLKANLPRTLVAVRTLMRLYSYDARRYSDETPDVIRQLLQGDCPIETTKSSGKIATPVVAVLNGGWEVYRVRRSEFRKLFKSTVTETECLRNLNQLIFKAIEAGEVLRLWKKSQDSNRS